MENKEINVLVLAYLGDAIYEVYVRKFLVAEKIAHVNDLQKKSLDFVSAKAQAKFLTELVDNHFLTEEETQVLKRARNYRSGKHPKNCDVITYKHATALEAVIGFLYLDHQEKRIDEIMEYILCRVEK